MAVNPGIYNFELQKGQDWEVELQITDSNGNPLPFDHKQLKAQVWDIKRCRKEPYANFDITPINPSMAQYKFALSGEQTLDFPKIAVYDLLVYDLDEDDNPINREYYLEGTITAMQTYTRI